ncbi:DUF2523 family protein [Escherichia coli]|uniref:DUF2523 family protein n=1 Tax=Escherichia coli TaxID=562 RepID=UPI000DA5C672|nr:DUF2523 family protein [Escherichia coli]EJE7372382.1 DUF2523 domain-containing protein [Shigella dysenteriae]EES9565199.1 DUF2523 domain-containing protein [Escherichia coli]EET9655784.1 DUF2523 domain-containing protein [Escherichia coli]EEU1619744.1 DUF2523 domain-containing protein [Escherichia coli]EEV9789898.1 DUF2523 domain-containing protein [Escherichia coli]
MFGILVSAFNTVLGFLLRTAVIKFIIFFSLYFIVQAFIPVLNALLPTNIDFISMFNSLPDSAWYFINIFAVTDGIKMMLSAYLTRFIIRRIPVIG